MSKPEKFVFDPRAGTPVYPECMLKALQAISEQLDYLIDVLDTDDKEQPFVEHRWIARY